MDGSPVPDQDAITLGPRGRSSPVAGRPGWRGSLVGALLDSQGRVPRKMENLQISVPGPVPVTCGSPGRVWWNPRTWSPENLVCTNKALVPWLGVMATLKPTHGPRKAAQVPAPWTTSYQGPSVQLWDFDSGGIPSLFRSLIHSANVLLSGSHMGKRGRC